MSRDKTFESDSPVLALCARQALLNRPEQHVGRSIQRSRKYHGAECRGHSQTVLQQGHMRRHRLLFVNLAEHIASSWAVEVGNAGCAPCLGLNAAALSLRNFRNVLGPAICCYIGITLLYTPMVWHHSALCSMRAPECCISIPALGWLSI